MTQPNPEQHLYLASGSPRRLALMQQIGLKPLVVHAPVEEVALPNETAVSYVRRMAIEKALAGFNKVPGKRVWVVGGDTAVVIGDRVLGKPKNQADASHMLRQLSGRSHQVLSAVAVVFDGEVFSAVNTTEVCFKELKDHEIQAYIASGEPEGKAGGYGIQGLGACFIEKITGSYSGVMGLPIYELNALLEQSNYNVVANNKA